VALLTSDGPVASALVSSSGFARTSSGFVGTSDGWTDLAVDHRLDWDYDSATDGNVLQTGEISLKTGPGDATMFALALGLATPPRAPRAPPAPASHAPSRYAPPPTRTAGTTI
jgi:glucoamylase